VGPVFNRDPEREVAVKNRSHEDRLHIYLLCGKDNRSVKTFGLAQRIIHPDHYIL